MGGGARGQGYPDTDRAVIRMAAQRRRRNFVARHRPFLPRMKVNLVARYRAGVPGALEYARFVADPRSGRARSAACLLYAAEPFTAPPCVSSEGTRINVLQQSALPTIRRRPPLRAGKNGPDRQPVSRRVRPARPHTAVADALRQFDRRVDDHGRHGANTANYTTRRWRWPTTGPSTACSPQMPWAAPPALRRRCRSAISTSRRRSPRSPQASTWPRAATPCSRWMRAAPKR